jgi:hypothetical protein
VKPEFRNQGYGYHLWQEALKHLPTQNIGLDGVIDQQENYKKSGFKLAYRNIRYAGKGSQKETNTDNIILLSKLPFDKILDYDAHVFPVKRARFLQEWIKQPHSLAIGKVVGDELYGFGMVRKCQKGYKVGPLFADNEKVADELFQALRNFVPVQETIYLDTPETNPQAIQLAERYGMKPMFETARMYTKMKPKINLDKVYGVTTFELG